MTCASCAARVEKKLNRMDGVTATVNYATEKAKVTYPPGLEVADLIATVVKTGYTAEEPPPPEPDPPEADARDAASGRPRRAPDPELGRPAPAPHSSPPLLAAARRAAGDGPGPPVRQLAVALAHPRRPRRRLGRRCPSTGPPGPTPGTARPPWTPWSRSARSPPSAGRCGRCSSATRACPACGTASTSPSRRTDGASTIYLEVAAGVVAFILLGRYLEARSKRRAGAALRALMELGAKDVAVLRGGAEVRIPVGQLAVGDRFVVRPGEKIATDGTVVEGTSAVDASMLTGESVPVDVAAGDTVTGGHRQHRGPAGRRGHPDRRRHPAGPDGPAGGGRAERQGRGAAARRPDLRGLRARGPR